MTPETMASTIISFPDTECTSRVRLLALFFNERSLGSPTKEALALQRKKPCCVSPTPPCRRPGSEIGYRQIRTIVQTNKDRAGNQDPPGRVLASLCRASAGRPAVPPLYQGVMPLHQSAMVGRDAAPLVFNVILARTIPRCPRAPGLALLKAETPKRTPAWGFCISIRGRTSQPCK